MKRFLLIAAAFAIVTPLAYAQPQSFTFGGRYSNYSTDINSGAFSVDTGREGSVGLVGQFRTGAFVLNGQWDHDLENGISIIDILPIDVGNFKRDRVEFTAGYAVMPSLDLQAGFRNETVDINTIGIGSFDFGDKFDHQAIVAGVNIHTPTIRPVGFYLDGRGYVGTAKFNVTGFDVESDTNGWKAEAGVQIPVGLSGWEITPGVEYESIQTDKYDVELKTNRFFVNFQYNFGR